MLKSLFAALLALGLAASPVLAQPAKIFLASTGLDTNDGSRATPKRSLQAGHDAVAPGGEIVLLDTAGYGPVTINKSVGIVVPPGVSGFITTTTGNGVTVNAGGDDIVTLRGLIVEGPGSGNGIYASSAGTLVVEDTTVRNFNEGIYVSSTVAMSVVVRNSAVRNSQYGIEVADGASNVYVNAVVRDVELTGNVNAFFVHAFNRGSLNLIIATHCAVTGTSGEVFHSGYPGAGILADGCLVSGSGTVFTTHDGSVNYTRGNNTIYGYTSFGTTPTSLNGQN